MDLTFSEDDGLYREQVRAWLNANTEELAGMARARDPLQAARNWQRKMYEEGYVGLPWPKRFGGQEASLTQQVVVAEELARARVPPLINTIGLTILAPTLILHGSEEQCRRFLPGILTGETIWCQGFSEPGAGSDLPALKTRAVLDGDDFVVTGQKVWTSLAPIADWCFLLVRTGPLAPKRDGISYLLCDMNSPGVEVRPLRNAGGGIHFSEVFFDEVRIPKSQLVGEINKGWEIARSSLGHERSGLSGVVSLENNLERLWKLAASTERDGTPLIAQPGRADKIAQYWIELEGLRYLGYRALSDQINGREPGASASVGKFFASKLRQKMAKTAFDMPGPLAPLGKKSPHVVERGRLHAGYIDSLGYSIGGGTSEIMLNSIAEKLLKLPRSSENS